MNQSFTLKEFEEFIQTLPDNDLDDWYVTTQGAAQNILAQFMKYLEQKQMLK